MVEEYNLDTNVLTQRNWREKGKLGQNIGWTVEVGDPIPKQEESNLITGIRESSENVCNSLLFTNWNTGLNFLALEFQFNYISSL